MKKKEPKVLMLPCPVRACDKRVMFSFEEFSWNYNDSEMARYMQRILNDMLRNHQDGKHAKAECCHHCHCCSCEHLVCRELAQ